MSRDKNTHEGGPQRPDATTETEKDEGRVLTPGGRRPKDQVHAVAPDELVRAGGAAPSVVARHVGAPDAAELARRAAHDLVVTPGGFRARSLVHLVPADHVLRLAGDRPRLLDLRTKALKELRLVQVAPEHVPALGSGWIVYAGWNNGGTVAVSSYQCRWQVPAEPANRSSQTIFLFPGIQNSGTNFGILQPVLQWGPSAAGGGQFWSVASWYVTSGGSAFHTTPARVNPGDSLTGVMTLTAQTGTAFDYDCEFQGIANTRLTVQGIAQLRWCNAALEAYDVPDCAAYPRAYGTFFEGIDIRTGTTSPSVNWSAVNRVTDCGQHCSIPVNSGTNGEVDAWYRSKTLVDTAVGAPGAAALGGRVYVAWAGTDAAHHLNVIASAARDEWRDKVTLGDTSPAGAALCAFGGRLYLAWSGTGNRQLNVMSSADGIAWTNKVTLGETSEFRPTLAALGGRLVLAWTGTDSAHRLNVMFSSDGVSWGGKRTLGDTSIDAPAVVEFGGRLFIAWTGTDAAHRLNVMSSSNLGETWQNKVTLGDTSPRGPSLLHSAGRLYLAWCGTDSAHRLNTLVSGDGIGFGGKVTYGDTSDFTPVLAECYGGQGLAWTGRDSGQHLNLLSI